MNVQHPTPNNQHPTTNIQVSRIPRWMLGAGHWKSNAGFLQPAVVTILLMLLPLRTAAEDQAAPAPVMPTAPAGAAAASVRAYFGRDCERALRTEIYSAREEILVAIYTITRKSLYSALVAMSRRGVKVSIKFDADQTKDSPNMKEAIQYLRDNGVPCKSIQLKGDKAKMHHKFMVIDRRRVATGSYNYSTTASRENYENLTVIDSPKIAQAFADEFERIKSQ